MKNIENSTKVISIYNLEANQSELSKSTDMIELMKSYSEMKYGSKIMIRKFAREFFEKYKEDFDYELGDLYIASTFISDIESSSHLIAKELQRIINYERYKKNLKSCKYIELLAKKKYLITSDYGKVKSKEERLKSQGNLELVIQPKLAKEDLLIIINDSYVTGSQWNLQENILRDSGVVSNINYYFIMKFNSSANNFDVTIEDFINNYIIKTEKDFTNLIIELSQKAHLTWNKRTILRSLNLESTEFRHFIESIRLEDLTTFHSKIILSDSHLVNKGIFSERIREVNILLKNKSREKDLNLRSPKDA